MRSKVPTGLLQPGQCCQSFEPPLPRVRAASASPPAAFCNSLLPFLQLATCGSSVSHRSPCVRFKVLSGLMQLGQCCQSLEPPLLRFPVASALPASCSTLLPPLQFAPCGLCVFRRSPCVKFKIPPGLLQPGQWCQSFEPPLLRSRAASALPPAASCDFSIPPLQLATCGLSVYRRSPCVRFKVPTGLPLPHVASYNPSPPLLQLAMCGLSMSCRSPCVRSKVPTGLLQPGQCCQPSAPSCPRSFSLASCHRFCSSPRVA